MFGIDSNTVRPLRPLAYRVNIAALEATLARAAAEGTRVLADAAAAEIEGLLE